MAVTEHDRRHFVVIGTAMAGEKAAQRRAALATTVAERIRVGFLLATGPPAIASEAQLDERAAGQIGLAESGRRLRR